MKKAVLVFLFLIPNVSLAQEVGTFGAPVDPNSPMNRRVTLIPLAMQIVRNPEGICEKIALYAVVKNELLKVMRPPGQQTEADETFQQAIDLIDSCQAQ